jgi:integrase
MEIAKIYPLNRNRFERSTAGGASVTPPKPKLLDQVRQAIQTRHYSYMTERAYVHWIKRFILFHNKRHPEEMGEAEIGRFLSSLATDSHVSASTQNQALNALLFLYREILNKDIGYVSGVVRAKRPHRLPVVLTRQEVRSIVGCLYGELDHGHVALWSRPPTDAMPTAESQGRRFHQQSNRSPSR